MNHHIDARFCLERLYTFNVFHRSFRNSVGFSKYEDLADDFLFLFNFNPLIHNFSPLLSEILPLDQFIRINLLLTIHNFLDLDLLGFSFFLPYFLVYEVSFLWAVLGSKQFVTVDEVQLRLIR